jgi:hypothetical protein
MIVTNVLGLVLFLYVLELGKVETFRGILPFAAKKPDEDTSAEDG